MKQYSATFDEGGQGHIHSADPGVGTKMKVKAQAKKVARDRLHLPASKVLEEAMVEHITTDRPNQPNPDNIGRAANLHGQKQLPSEPKDDELDFEVKTYRYVS